MDKEKTWAQVDEIIQVLNTGQDFLNFPDDSKLNAMIVEGGTSSAGISNRLA